MSLMRSPKQCLVVALHEYPRDTGIVSVSPHEAELMLLVVRDHIVLFKV